MQSSYPTSTLRRPRHKVLATVKIHGQKMCVKQTDYATLNWIMSVKIGIGEKRGSKRLYA